MSIRDRHRRMDDEAWAQEAVVADRSRVPADHWRCARHAIEISNGRFRSVWQDFDGMCFPCSSSHRRCRRYDEVAR